MKAEETQSEFERGKADPKGPEAARRVMQVKNAGGFNSDDKPTTVESIDANVTGNPDDVGEKNKTSFNKG